MASGYRLKLGERYAIAEISRTAKYENGLYAVDGDYPGDVLMNDVTEFCKKHNLKVLNINYSEKTYSLNGDFLCCTAHIIYIKKRGC